MGVSPERLSEVDAALAGLGKSEDAIEAIKSRVRGETRELGSIDKALVTLADANQGDPIEQMGEESAVSSLDELDAVSESDSADEQELVVEQVFGSEPQQSGREIQSSQEERSNDDATGIADEPIFDSEPPPQARDYSAYLVDSEAPSEEESLEDLQAVSVENPLERSEDSNELSMEKLEENAAAVLSDVDGSSGRESLDVDIAATLGLPDGTVSENPSDSGQESAPPMARTFERPPDVPGSAEKKRARSVTPFFLATPNEPNVEDSDAPRLTNSLSIPFPSQDDPSTSDPSTSDSSIVESESDESFDDIEVLEVDEFEMLVDDDPSVPEEVEDDEPEVSRQGKHKSFFNKIFGDD